MPYGTVVTSLIPEFVLSINAVAKIGEEEQIREHLSLILLILL